MEPESLLLHASHVRRLARRLVFDDDLAREVEQETWLAALQHAPRDLRHPRAWLTRVVHHAARRLWSRRTRRGDVESGVAPPDPGDPGRAGDPVDLLDREQWLRELLAALGRLPEPVRIAVVLHHLDGLTVRAVARRTGAPLETVRSRLKRGLALLREDLGRGRRPGAAWSLALVRGLELDPPFLRTLGLARELIGSLLVMNAITKTTAATVGLTLVLLAGWALFGSGPAAPDPIDASAPADLVAVEASAPAAPTPGDLQPAARATVEAPLEELAAAEPPPAPSTGAIDVRLVFADDGSAAAGVALVASGPDNEPTWTESSPDGRVLLEELEPGSWRLQPVLGGFAAVNVVAGVSTERRLEIPQGVRVTGRVVGPHGAPIPGADVFLWPGGYLPQYTGQVVARSDARGAFEVRTVPAQSGACLSARAAGWAPSVQTVVTGATRTEVELVLVLNGPGRRLVGWVLAPDGEPVAGAKILVGPERDVVPIHRDDGTRAYPPIGQLAAGGSDGRFEVSGVPLENVSVQVRADGHPAWRGTWPEGGPSPLEIHLEPGATLSGVVRSTSGDPLSGARFLAGTGVGFADLETHSGPDGAYSLGPFPSGPCPLAVEGPEGERLKASPTLVAGEDRRWDPVLERRLEVRGRVEAPGRSLAGWTVFGYRAPRPDEDRYFEQVRTDGEGSFVLSRAPQGEIAVVLKPPRAPFAVRRVEGVRPGGPELVLVPDPELEPTALISGRLVDAGGEPLRAATVYAASEKLGRTLVHPDEHGRFELGPLPAGEWTLEVDAGVAGWAIVRRTRELATGETWRAGELTLGEGGRARILWRGYADGEAPAALVLDAGGGTVERLTLEGQVTLSALLPPGDYQLVLEGPDPDRSQRRAFSVSAGLETPVEF